MLATRRAENKAYVLSTGTLYPPNLGYFVEAKVQALPSPLRTRVPLPREDARENRFVHWQLGVGDKRLMGTGEAKVSRPVLREAGAEILRPTHPTVPILAQGKTVKGHNLDLCPGRSVPLAGKRHCVTSRARSPL